jgi:AhpD family alkylhydroperoxidase
MSQPRINYAQQSPELFRKYLDFSMANRSSSSIEKGIAHLVDLRASQLNGCAFCVDMHTKEARIDGERELRLHHVVVWRESPLFSPRERAALAWTEALTRLAPEGVSDALYAEVREQFGERELSDLTFLVMAINGWNRASIAFRAVPGSQDKAYGLDKAGLV